MKHICIVAAVIGVFVWLNRDASPASPYDYDESDYMYAAGRGYLANYTDTPTQSIVDFVRMGMGRNRDAGSRGFLSEFIRTSGDIVFYRHWHGPLYVDWLVTVSPFRQNERLIRMLGMVIPILGIVVLYVGTFRLFESTTTAILAAVMYGWSHVVARTTILAPHQLFALCCLASLLAAVSVLKTKDARYWYASLIFAGLAFATLEVAFVLIATLILFVFQERLALQVTSKFLIRSALVFLGSVLAVYPASLWKLSFVKAYAFMAYLALFRKSPWGHATLAQTWLTRLENAPVEWLLVITALVLFFRDARNPAHRYARAVLYFSLLMVLVTLRVLTTDPRYLLPFVPMLALFSAWMLGGWISERPWKGQIAATALICGLMLLNTRLYTARHPVATDQNEVRLLAAVRDHHLEQGTLILPHDEVPAFHYYFPQATVKSYLDEKEMEALARSEKADALVRPGLDLELPK
jgi:hypothetical protein